MEIIKQAVYEGERALFMGKNLEIYDTIFLNGESPLKESGSIKLYRSGFKWKYPLWYSSDVYMKDCTLFETARAGIWYTDNITVEDTIIEAPKTFRRCEGISLKNITMPKVNPNQIPGLQSIGIDEADVEQLKALQDVFSNEQAASDQGGGLGGAGGLGGGFGGGLGGSMDMGADLGAEPGSSGAGLSGEAAPAE